MALKFFILLVSIAAANAGLALTSTSDNTYRSLGNLAQVSTQSKTIETPYSSSSKSDIRVSNPSVYASPAPIGHYVSSAPAVHQYSSAPVIQHYSQAPIHHGEQVYASAPGPIISKTAYAVPAVPAVQYAHQSPIAQPIYAHSTPVSYAQHTPVHYAQPAQVHYAQPTQVHYAQHSPVAYAHPGQVSYAAHAAPVSYSAHAAHQVSYSPANAVAHLTYNNVNDHVNYAW